MQYAEKFVPKKLLITRKELKDLGIYVSNSTLLRWEDAGNFPKRIRMSNTRIAWLLAEIEEWISEKISNRSS